MQKIVPFLWFDGGVREAAELYTSVFPSSRVVRTTAYSEASAGPTGREAGELMSADLELGGSAVSLLNGGPQYRPTPAISLFAILGDRAAVDAAWAALTDGGQVMMELDEYPWSPRYGWVSDRWGVSWQLALGDPDQVHGQTVSPCLLFVGEQCGRAEEALELYAATFASDVDGIMRNDGLVQHAQVVLEGVTTMLMDGSGPHEFGFSEGVSLMVSCEDQAEVDRLWSALSAVPEAERCGWLKDRFGVSWQIVPRALFELLGGADREGAGRATQAMLQMKKIDVAELRRAYAGTSEG